VVNEKQVDVAASPERPPRTHTVMAVLVRW